MQPVVNDKRSNERRAYRVNEFCEAYRVSRATVYKLMRAGKLRTATICGRRVIPVEAAEALLLPTPAVAQTKPEAGR